jgi:hypothetical protein
MVSFGILQISLIHEESDKFIVLLAMIAISLPPLFFILGKCPWEGFSSLRSSMMVFGLGYVPAKTES